MPDTITIRPISSEDQASWQALYAAYADFYETTQTDAMRAKVWSWLMDPNHDVNGFIAVQTCTPIGFAHYRPFARPLAASIGGFLDDLFVTPEARGTGAADALIKVLADEGRKQNWTILRWITAEDNARARKLYDRVAEATPWVTYDMEL